MLNFVYRRRSMQAISWAQGKRPSGLVIGSTRYLHPLVLALNCGLGQVSRQMLHEL